MNKLLSLLLLTLILFFSSSPAYAQVNYSVIDSDPNTTGFIVNGYSNQIVRDSNGNIYVAYGISTNQSTHWYCFVRRSIDGGATWEDAVRIENFPDSSSVTSMAVDSKDNLMVGLSFNVGSFFTMSSDKGKNWSPALQLLDGGWDTWDFMPSLAIDSKDGIHSAFHAQFGWQVPPSNIFYTFSQDGRSFSQPVDITRIPQENSYGNGAGPANIQIGKDDEIFIMGGKGKSGDADSYSILLHYSQSLWSGPVILNDGNTYGAGGDFVIDSGGILHIFFAQIDPLTSNRRVFYKTYNPGNKELSIGRAITPPDENVQNISAGIYQNDAIYIAYDILDNSLQKTVGVYVRKSEDGFSKTYAVSETVGARSANLRSYYNNMHDKDKVDIIWVEPDTVGGGELLAYYDLSNGIRPAGKATLDVFVPYFMNPGQDATIVVRYQNFKGEDITNAAIVLDVPSDLIFLNASNGGIYKDRDGSPQVFWRLNDLRDGTKGAQFVKMLIPWGMPDVKGKIVANLIGDNIFSNYDPEKYYNYEEREILVRSDMDENDINKFLSGNSDVKELLDYSINLGYLWNKVGQKLILSQNRTITILYLMDPKDYTPLMIKKIDNLPVFAEQMQGSVYTKFNTKGGYTTNSSDDSFTSFGKWTESHSLTEARCQVNCTINKVPGWIGEAASKSYNMASSALNCASCAKSKGKETADCINCLNAYKDVPGVSYAVDVAQCLKECLENPNQHICTEDKKECNWSILGYYFYGADTVFTTICNKTTGTYAIASYRTYCTGNTKCVNGECVEKDDDLCKKPSFIAPTNEVGVCRLDDFEIVEAHDPNAIYVSPDGDILPDEILTYTIEYENTGTGTAFDVFILNELDENLDETTLKINDNGTFSPASRLLKWQIGELPTGQKGSVSYSVKPKSNLVSGTVISNQAEVHFPSAKEVTPTNIVASKINGLSADNKRVTVNIGTSTTISLSGREVTGKKPTFKILTYPKFGSIKPNLLDVVYTAPDNTGSDIFTYTAVVSGVESSPATVSIEIKGTDVTPPSIVKTYPEDNAENIRFNTQPNPDNTYLPEIWVLFDEELSTNTIGTYNFYIMESGTEIISADVRYDPVSRRVFIRPLSELKPATEYVVNVMNVSDRAGNMLENLYKFKFTTVAKRTLRLSLSDNASELDFYEVLINTKAENKTVGLSSIGISAVNITEVKLSQTGEEFSIVEDKCSQRLLEVDTDCHITIGFAPNTVGNKSATLMITSDDDKNSSLTVRLKGKAIGQQINDAGTDATTSQDGTNVTTEAKDNGGCGCNYLE
ncbi:MAG: DUF7619 domain-containing protein [Myxococcota bacterium]